MSGTIHKGIAKMKIATFILSLILITSACDLLEPQKSSNGAEVGSVAIGPEGFGTTQDLGYAQYLPNIAYTEGGDNSSPFLKLDLYFKDLQPLRPIMVYLHGGGWNGPEIIDGAKENIQKSPNLVSFFIKSGFLVASINRRQIDFSQTPAITYHDQLSDIAKAIKWLQINANHFGGDGMQILLMGYSSGAHLATLLASNRRYLSQEGVNNDSLRGVIAIDSHAYDIPLALSLMPGTNLENSMSALKFIFGNSIQEQQVASPAWYISKNAMPPMLLISAGIKDRKEQNISNIVAANFKDKLLSNNHQVRHFNFPQRDHTELLEFFGKSGDTLERIFTNFIHESFSPRRFNNLPSDLKGEITKILQTSVSSSEVNPSKLPGMAVGVITSSYKGVIGLGTTEIGKEIKPNGDTFFGIGSVSKIFVGLTLARLVAERHLDIDRPAKSYLPSSLSSLIHQDITLKELITHQSGLLSMPENIEVFRDENLDGVSDYVDWSPAYNYQLSHLISCLKSGFCVPRLATRGDYQYSNLGITFAELSLEYLTGLGSFEELIKKYFNHELGMDDTGTNVPDFLSKTERRRAIGYQLTGKSLTPRPFSDMGVMAGSGEVITTANNLLTLLEHLIGQNTNNSAFARSAQLATEKIFQYQEQKAIGYAIDISEDSAGQTFYSKSGATKSSQAFIIWVQEPKVGVVVLTNGAGGEVNIGKLAKAVIDILLKN